jgi:hypothetical protein
MTKYCTERLLGYNGFTDGKTTLEPADDAATQNLGSNWRMPTKAECEELENNCTWKLTTRKRKKGYKVTGPNGKSIFLPAAGLHMHSMSYRVGDEINYWSSSIAGQPYIAMALSSSGNIRYSPMERYIGISVRPVCP